MSDDLIQRLRAHVSPGWGSAGGAMAQAADRIEADEALMRQALEALTVCTMHGWVLADHETVITAAIAALRARLGESKT